MPTKRYQTWKLLLQRRIEPFWPWELSLTKHSKHREIWLTNTPALKVILQRCNLSMKKLLSFPSTFKSRFSNLRLRTKILTLSSLKVVHSTKCKRKIIWPSRKKLKSSIRQLTCLKMTPVRPTASSLTKSEGLKMIIQGWMPNSRLCRISFRRCRASSKMLSRKRKISRRRFKIEMKERAN